MRTIFIISKFFSNTRELIRFATQHAQVSVSIVNDEEEELEIILEHIQLRDRVWFEGAGRLLHAMLERNVWKWMRGATLRADADDLAQLPFPECWKMISNLIVPDTQTAEEILRKWPPPTGRAQLQVTPESDRLGKSLGKSVPFEEMNALIKILQAEPGGLSPRTWEAILAAGELAKGSVLIVGSPPAEYLDFLQTAMGCKLFDRPEDLPSGEADTVVFWEHLHRANAAGTFKQAVQLLRPAGSVAAVPGEETTDTLSGNALFRLLGDKDVWSAPRRVEPRGRVVTAKMVSADESAVVLHSKAADNPPLVSLIIFVYNEQDAIDQAIWSLRRQTYSKLEIVVVDDGSTDATAEIVEKHLGDPRVRYFYKPHSGRSETRNMGLEKARGDFIGWLGGDDEAFPNRIQKEMEVLLNNPDVDLVHSDAIAVRPDGSVWEYRAMKEYPMDEMPAAFMNGCQVLDASALVRRNVYDRVGRYDPAFVRAQDYEFFVRCVIHGGVKFHHIASPLVKIEGRLHVPEVDALNVDMYHIISHKLISAFGVERVMGQRARDLHQSPYLGVAEAMITWAIRRGATVDHPVMIQAAEYVKHGGQSPRARDRAIALNLLGILACLRGEVQKARQDFQEALQLAPDMKDAQMNLTAIEYTKRKQSEPSLTS